MFPRLHGEKIILLEFSGFGMQIEGEQYIVSTVGHVVHCTKMPSRDEKAEIQPLLSTLYPLMSPERDLFLGCQSRRGVWRLFFF